MTNTNETYQERILKVQVYIQNNLDRELSLEELASVAFFSPYHFHRIFSSIAGESVKNYLRRLRLERASRDLILTEMSLIDIAIRAGYDSQSAFQRAFKETYKTTPKSFREKSQEFIIQNYKEKTTENALEVVVKNIEPITVAFARQVGSYKNALQTWFHLVNEFGLNVILSEKTTKISIAHDSDDITPDAKLRYDACITINHLPNFKPRGKIGTQTLHGGKYAVATYVGPIEKIDSAYHFLFGRWLPESGHEPDDHPNFLLHRSIPFYTPADELVTEIYLPLK